MTVALSELSEPILGHATSWQHNHVNDTPEIGVHAKTLSDRTHTWIIHTLYTTHTHTHTHTLMHTRGACEHVSTRTLLSTNTHTGRHMYALRHIHARRHTYDNLQTQRRPTSNNNNNNNNTRLFHGPM